MLILTDDFADSDLIGHDDYRDGLVEMIREVNAGGSFTIGVYGQWGCGKTSMLRQIKKSLDEGKSNDSPLVTVWFNPWQFVSEEHLIIPFFHTLIAVLKEEIKKSPLQTVKEKLPDFLEKITHVPLALIYGMEGELKLPLLKAKICSSRVFDYQQQREQEIDARHKQEHEAVALAAEKYESTYYNLLQILRDAVGDLELKIVVFIDDLDRCLPEKAVELLEGLKVLLDLKGFVFVMGVAQEVIERGIRVRYKELYLADRRDDLPDIEGQYLDKIIQFPFTLPAADPEKLRQNILARELAKLPGAEPYIEMINQALGSNPRTIKRFINAVSFAIRLADKKSQNGSEFHPELLIKISLVGYLFPALYRQLEQYPGHLVMLERIVGDLEREGNGRKKEGEQELLEGQSHGVQKKGLPIFDQWLEDDKFVKLIPVLRVRTEGDNDDPGREIGFGDAETVDKYLRFLSVSLQSEVEAKEKGARSYHASLKDQMTERMEPIKGGTFMMGDEETGKRERKVSPFLLDKYPVTQALYEQVMGQNPSLFKGEDRPVEQVSWFEAVEFCNELSSQTGLTPAYDIKGEEVVKVVGANGYRLPSETEWDYACRAGSTGERYGELNEIAWYDENSGGRTHGVGQKTPNVFGLYDMLGNVWEWTGDGSGSGEGRVLRGGSWIGRGRDVRSACRRADHPADRNGLYGFRLPEVRCEQEKAAGWGGGAGGTGRHGPRHGPEGRWAVPDRAGPFSCSAMRLAMKNISVHQHRACVRSGRIHPGFTGWVPVRPRRRKWWSG